MELQIECQLHAMKSNVPDYCVIGKILIEVILMEYDNSLRQLSRLDIIIYIYNFNDLKQNAVGSKLIPLFNRNGYTSL